MVIFQSPENFFGFLFFAWVIVNIVGLIVVMIVYRSNEPEEETEEQQEDVQAFIDGIENAIDNGWYFPEEDFEEYKRLTEGDRK